MITGRSSGPRSLKVQYYCEMITHKHVTVVKQTVVDLVAGAQLVSVCES